MYRKLFHRLFVIESRICFNTLLRNVVYSSYRFHTMYKPSLREIQQFRFYCSDNIKTVAETEKKIIFENNPNVLELEKMFQCSKSDAISVYKYFSTNSIQIDFGRMDRTRKWLNRMGAENSIILKNLHLFLVPLDSLKISYHRLNSPEWKQFIDFMPLLGLSISESKIRRIQRQNIREIRDRVYMFSEYFSCEPHIASHCCAKHLFLLEMDLELLKRKMILLQNNVSAENLMRDLDLLARSEDKIKARIEYLQMLGVGHIMPWMIKCTKEVLKRTIEIRKNIAGSDGMKIHELLTKKLQLHGRTATKIFTRNPFLQNLNYETACERVEELLKLFTPKEVTENIQLLNHPVGHIKIRVAELMALDPSKVSPEVCGMSKRSYRLWYEQLKNKNSNDKEINEN